MAGHGPLRWINERNGSFSSACAEIAAQGNANTNGGRQAAMH
jgi:hypothetical protein